MIKKLRMKWLTLKGQFYFDMTVKYEARLGETNHRKWKHYRNKLTETCIKMEALGYDED